MTDQSGSRAPDVMAEIRKDWQERWAGPDEGWSDVEPRYTYALHMSQHPDYTGKSWTSVEPHLQREWESRHPETPWDKAKHTVKHGWEKITGRS